MESTESLGPIPEDNKPGHHPRREQDKPDPEAFARRLGLAADDGDRERHPPVDDGGAGTSRPSAAAEGQARRRRGPAFQGPAPVSPVDPAELVAEAIELSVRAAVAVSLLPWRLTAATLRAGLRIARSD
jgi:hypothetical protein